MEFRPERDITIEGAIKDYLADKTFLGRLSDASVINRASELNRFQRFCQSHGIEKPDAIHKNLLTAYLRKINVSNGTKITLINIYRSFFDYLVGEGLVFDNIAATLARPKTRKVDPDFLTYDELETVYRWIAENTGRMFVDRNLLLISIMVELGLRVSAIINLKLNDVRLDAKQLWVRQKGGAEKQVPITDSIVSQFKNYLAVRNHFRGFQYQRVCFHGHQRPVAFTETGL
jgi:integrase/recombinase XerD